MLCNPDKCYRYSHEVNGHGKCYYTGDGCYKGYLAKLWEIVKLRFKRR
jgi:hypothetical protein